MIAAGAAACGGTLAWADAAPPRPRQSAEIDLPLLSDGKMKLEVLAGGDTINIILDKDTYAKLKKGK